MCDANLSLSSPSPSSSLSNLSWPLFFGLFLFRVVVKVNLLEPPPRISILVFESNVFQTYLDTNQDGSPHSLSSVSTRTRLAPFDLKENVTRHQCSLQTPLSTFLLVRLKKSIQSGKIVVCLFIPQSWVWSWLECQVVILRIEYPIVLCLYKCRQVER